MTIETIKLLALDPGSLNMGWAQLIVREGYPHEVRGSGVMHANTRSKSNDALARMIAQVRDRVGQYDVVAVEEPGPYPFKNRQAGPRIYEVIGAIRAICQIEAVTCALVAAPAIKEALGGNATSGKGEVHWSVFRLGYQVAQVGRQRCRWCREMRQDDAHSPDAADAVAIGHVAADRIRLGV